MAQHMACVHPFAGRPEKRRVGQLAGGMLEKDLAEHIRHLEPATGIVGLAELELAAARAPDRTYLCEGAVVHIV